MVNAEYMLPTKMSFDVIASVFVGGLMYQSLSLLLLRYVCAHQISCCVLHLALDLPYKTTGAVKECAKCKIISVIVVPYQRTVCFISKNGCIPLSDIHTLHDVHFLVKLDRIQKDVILDLAEVTCFIEQPVQLGIQFTFPPSFWGQIPLRAFGKRRLSSSPLKSIVTRNVAQIAQSIYLLYK